MRIQDLGDNLFFVGYAVALPGGELYTIGFYRTGYSESAIQGYSKIVRTARITPVSSNASNPVPTELVGRWVVNADQSVSFPAACREMWLEFGADGILRNGGSEDQYMYLASIDTHATEHGYDVDQKLTGHNNLPNCQGLSAEHVSTRFKPDIYVEVRGDELRFFFWERGDMYLDYHRVTR